MQFKKGDRVRLNREATSRRWVAMREVVTPHPHAGNFGIVTSVLDSDQAGVSVQFDNSTIEYTVAESDLSDANTQGNILHNIIFGGTTPS